MSLRTFTESDALPDRIVLYAQKGWGKTTLGAFAPKPIILMSRGETGYLTLRRNNLVPDAPFAIVDEWGQLFLELKELIVKGAAGRETVVLDALGGFEWLCQEHICATKFGNDWGKFADYGKGQTACLPELTKLCDLLDEVSQKLKLRIIILGHSKVKAFANPMGASFDRYIVDCADKTWEPLNGWSDAVLFGKFRTVAAELKGETKGVAGTDRVIYTSCTDAFEAKNRHGLAAEIQVPKKPELMWSTIGAKLDAAVKLPARVAASEPAKEAATVGEQLGNMHELKGLIEEHKMGDYIHKWCKHFKVESLDKLTEKNVADLINKIKSAKAAA